MSNLIFKSRTKQLAHNIFMKRSPFCPSLALNNIYATSAVKESLAKPCVE